MHMLVARNEHDDACTAKHCISHQKFAMQIIEQVISVVLFVLWYANLSQVDYNIGTVYFLSSLL